MPQAGNPALIDRIKRKIVAEGGAISFAEYMEMCLYDTDFGYYTNDDRKVGKEGDFYTSAYIGGAMGWTLAAFAAEQFGRLNVKGKSGNLVLAEWGGGDGRLAKSVLDTLAAEYPDIYERVRFVSIESSPFHRSLQQEQLAGHASRIEAVLHPGDERLNRLLSVGNTVLYANELLDALPVHRLRKVKGELKEIYVVWEEERETFGERLLPVQERVTRMLERLNIRLKEGQTAELNLNAAEWVASLGGLISSGAAALIDYGDVTEELYGSHRMNGTFMCYRRHAAHDNPYVWVGEQDLTAHVDFGMCRMAAEDAGFSDIRLRSQKQFLVDYGILNRLLPHDGADPFSPEAKNNRAIRQLLLSDGMSELFKVLTIRKE
ncbi:class I SAM-dependent methyltransferase [Paenibacillus thermotolerans]|uniref:class I SAM-dependent methyltransferase n=1 Tax=Paenibacillus thermotolerans TaxID=3027807 RepID=UPI0023677EA7|nr:MULTISPECIES: SAM-dependent methyltransferase [unclassified Paenibacillus]